MELSSVPNTSGRHHLASTIIMTTITNILLAAIETQSTRINSLEERLQKLEARDKQSSRSSGPAYVTKEHDLILIKDWEDWESVPGQLLRDNRLGLRMSVSFFGTRPSETMVRIIVDVMSKANIRTYSIDDDDNVVEHHV